MDFNEFLLETAKSKLLNPKYIPTLIAVFGKEGHGKSIAKCSEVFLNDQPRQTTDSYLKEIYKFFWENYPELEAINGKGQRKILTDHFVKLYKNRGNTNDNTHRPQPLTNPQNIPTPESIPELTTLEFIGRDRDLTNLANLSRQAKIVLIKAGAGVGKSTLAREFLQTQFKKVIRLEMGLESGNVTPAEEKVSQILRKDFDEEPSRDFGINLDILREKLADRANPIGVLIDNLEPALDENYRFREKLRGYDALLAVLGDRDVCSFTLITSRRSLITPRARVHEYSLEGLDITAWRQYFHDCENGADSEALLQMRDAYNGNAKVMDILHGAIKNRFDGNIGAYWNRYKDALLADSELETLISVEMDWLRDNQPDAYKLLCRMGCYRYQDVKTVPFEGLICLLWDIPESHRTGIVQYLSKTSLIEIKDEYYLHPAIRYEAKKRLEQNGIDWETVNRKAADFWTNTIKVIRSTEDALTAFEAYHHYLAILDYESAGSVIILCRVDQWENSQALGRSFLKMGYLLDTLKKSIVQIIKNILNKNILTNIYSILGNISILTGEMSDAIEYHEISKNYATETNSKEFEINGFFNIGFSQLATFDIISAKDNLESAIEISKNSSYRGHTIDALICLAYVYSETGEADNVINCINQAMELRRESYFSPSLGYQYYFLGKALKNISKLTESEDTYKESLKFTENSKSSIVEAATYLGLAEIARIQGHIEEAMGYHTKSIDILEKFKVIAGLSEAYFQLGLTYKAMREHDQAEEYKAKALELFAQMEAPKQIERVNKAFGGNIE